MKMKKKKWWTSLAAVAVAIGGWGISTLPAAPADPARMEQPARLKGTPERILQHTGFCLSYNRERCQPNWVAWCLEKSETEGTLRRSDDFQPDPLLPPSQQVTTDDYKGSGYDRGHMVPAADMKWSPAAMRECFYLSNICPQNHSLNAGAWAKLEAACRRWARQEGRIYIACGPLFDAGRKQKSIGSTHRIAVPTGFFKVVLSTRRGHEKAIGFVYTNRSSRQTMDAAATTVDAVEQLTGIDFFPLLDDRLERRLEAEYSLRRWQ